MHSSAVRRIRRSMLTALAGVVSLFLITALLWWSFRPQPAWVQGQIEVTQVRVASKIAGRVETIEVDEGDHVTAGQILVTLSTPDVLARAAQTDALIAAARAQADQAEAGAREEQIQAAHAQFEAAAQMAELAEVTARRIERLYADGVVPEQRRDEAGAQARSARAQVEAAEQSYRIALQATRPEELRAASAQLAHAESGRAEVQAALDEAIQRAPAAGEVTTRIVEPGEVVSAGTPLLVISRTDAPWLVLNLREDLLAGVKTGAALTGKVPALGGQEISFEVYYIAPQASFATWRSTRDLGGFDLRTFEVRARPRDSVEGLRAGMSVLIDERGLR